MSTFCNTAVNLAKYILFPTGKKQGFDNLQTLLFQAIKAVSYQPKSYGTNFALKTYKDGF